MISTRPPFALSLSKGDLGLFTSASNLIKKNKIKLLCSEQASGNRRSQSPEAKSFKDMPVEPPKKSLAAFLFFAALKSINLKTAIEHR